MVQQGNKQDVHSQTATSDASSPPLPIPSLPKGGGGIHGIGEKFAANPVTGTGSMTVPIAISPGRSGFGPQLSLSYDSGSGNGPFGLGWSLNLPSITRKTDKGLPRYCDADESDVFLLSGAEDLVPVLDSHDQRVRSRRIIYGVTYDIYPYRPRIEGLFARIERWVAVDTTLSHWRSITRDNVTTLYGFDAKSRIADPTDPRKIFSYRICRTFDDEGNIALYNYVAEDGIGVNHALSHEANRTDPGRAAQCYLKTIRYGNAQPYFSDWLPNGTDPPLPTDWHFEVVMDYGDHMPDRPTPAPDQPWPVRLDPFSTYRAGFEVRMYRRCKRVLLFHHFPAEDGIGENCLVRSTDFLYSDEQASDDPRNPIYTFLQAVTQSGYRRQDNGYVHKSLPALKFEYSQPQIQPDVLTLDADSLANLPEGLDGSRYQWVDLDGEGLTGILTDFGGAWGYKRNSSPLNETTLSNGNRTTHAHFSPLELVTPLPSHNKLNGQRLVALSGDGRLDVVTFDDPTPGFFKRTADGNWEPYQQFTSLPHLDWSEPNLKFVDLTGDGLADILLTEDGLFSFWPSLGEAGFGDAEIVRTSWDEEHGPKVVLADGTQTIFLADMSGDGLSDLVRIRNGEVCYWPNLGYGHFGAKVSMQTAPRFADEERFDPRRIRLADIDGSGTTDLLYISSDGVLVCFNQSGNSWATPQHLAIFPTADNLSAVQVTDLLGNGTACLVWSSPLPGEAIAPLRYVDLMGGQKPHLMVGTRNNLGSETHLRYAPSTRFYLADKVAGKPWITRLPFPVHVVEQIEVFDRIGRNRFVSRYAYHHGYFDGFEREFRGFGMVEQWDTQELAAFTVDGNILPATNTDETSYVPPVLTRTWFHTGIFIDKRHISRQFENEYYHESDLNTGVAGLTAMQSEAMLLDESILPKTIRLADGTRQPFTLSGNEAQEACRALKGSLLRQEIYALDGTEAEERPYSVSEHNHTIELLQSQSVNRHAVFFTHARETIDFHYERALFEINGQKVADPRVSHSITLAVDTFGNVLQTVTVGYGRRYNEQDDPNHLLTTNDQMQQQRLLATCSVHTYTNAIQQDNIYHGPLEAEACTYELINCLPDRNIPQVTNLFRFDEIMSKVQTASDGLHDLPYEDSETASTHTSTLYRRLLEQTRALYRRDDLSGPLPLGQLQALARPFESYKLALTPGLLTSVYQRPNSSGIEVLVSDPVNVLAHQGGYVRSNKQKADGSFPASDPDDYWWVPSGHIFYSPTENDSGPQELAYARQHFFLPHRFHDPFGNTTTVTYDSYGLLPQDILDALGNRSTAGERDTSGNLTQKGNNYRVLQPQLMMDTNRNRSAVAFDTLGMIVGTAVMGKPEEHLGDTLDGFVPDMADAVIATHLQNPLNNPHNLLQRATSRLVYDLFAYQRTQGDPQPQSAVVYTLARETHDADLAFGQQTRIQHSFSYADGFGREIQKKIQAEPGPLIEGGPENMSRWVGSGWTIFNNKGKPVRKYEPFFSATHYFEFAMAVGVSPILFYDPSERVVATLHPNHTYEKVVFDPWKQATWDVNDTVLIDPKADLDVEDFFRRLPDADYLPGWYTQRQGGALGTQEQTAAQKTAMHATTPTLAHLDTLGRPFLTVAHNRFERSGTTIDEYYASRVTLDIQGHQRAISDAQQRIVLRYDYNLLGEHMHQTSIEAGERWMLNDAGGKPLYAWDSRGHTQHIAYDALQRPIEAHLQIGSSEVLVARTIYGEIQSDPEGSNLRGKVYQVSDGAGLVTNKDYDFKGNLLHGSRQLIDNISHNYKKTLNWSTSVPLETQIYGSSTIFDALNRPIQLVAPHSNNTAAKINIVQPSYNEANLLEALNVWLEHVGEPVQLLDATTANLIAVKNIDYNAQGQRTLIEYGNSVSTHYKYDPLTFRLTHLFTTRGSGFPGDGAHPPSGVQNMHYIYDPVGNITYIQDDAQQTIYFRNRRVEPSTDYTYDAIYRLIEASGREHLGQASGGQVPVPLSYDDTPRLGIVQPGDGNAMGRYLQQYVYDEVGNILLMLHQGTDPSQPGWKRAYAYNQTSLLEPGRVSNRLSSTQIDGDPSQLYAYDSHGNMTTMPHLPLMQWDYQDMLQTTAQQVVSNGGTPETTYYVYDANGRRVRKVTERQATAGQTPTLMKERIYLGGFEIYREYNGDGNAITLERETLSIMDDKQRIVLVETRTQGSDGSPAQLLRYQFGNHLGSASLELDEHAQIISYEEYYPFGSTSYQAVRNSTETPRRYRYTGKERDEENGLYYYGVRYYACWLGRWTSCDPAGMVDGVNIYQYVKNNPIKHIDIVGHQALPQPNIPPAPISGTRLIVDVATTESAETVGAGTVSTGEVGGGISTGVGGFFVAIVLAVPIATLVYLHYYPNPAVKPTENKTPLPSASLVQAPSAPPSAGVKVPTIPKSPPGTLPAAPVMAPFIPTVSKLEDSQTGRFASASGSPPSKPSAVSKDATAVVNPNSPAAKAKSAAMRKAFMAEQLRSILANPKDLLRSLVDPTTGKWKGTTHLSAEPAVQAGHKISRHSGKPETFALEDAFENQRANWRGESQGVVFEREFVDIDGHPVEKVTAEHYEAQGILPKGTVTNAQTHPGWTPTPK